MRAKPNPIEAWAAAPSAAMAMAMPISSVLIGIRAS
jgi:hypothetical protein